MIADALRVEIDDYCLRARQNNALFCHARAGTLRPEVTTTYLVNIHHLVGHTPVALTRARERALAGNDARLAAHFEHKMAEEHGHDTWSADDLKRRGESPNNDRILPAMNELLDFIDATIDEHPAKYLSYMLFAEAVTVLLGPEWLTFMAERCGVPTGSITVIENHVDLDREHVEEAFDVIDELVPDPGMLPQLRDTLRASMAHFDRFCDELVTSRFEGPAESASTLEAAPPITHAPAAPAA